jgi:hypothetical protein
MTLTRTGSSGLEGNTNFSVFRGRIETGDAAGANVLPAPGFPPKPPKDGAVPPDCVVGDSELLAGTPPRPLDGDEPVEIVHVPPPNPLNPLNPSGAPGPLKFGLPESASLDSPQAPKAAGTPPPRAAERLAGAVVVAAGNWNDGQTGSDSTVGDEFDAVAFGSNDGPVEDPKRKGASSEGLDSLCPPNVFSPVPKLGHAGKGGAVERDAGAVLAELEPGTIAKTIQSLKGFFLINRNGERRKWSRRKVFTGFHTASNSVIQQ